MVCTYLAPFYSYHKGYVSIWFKNRCFHSYIFMNLYNFPDFWPLLLIMFLCVPDLSLVVAFCSLGKPIFPCQRVTARWGKLDCPERSCDLEGTNDIMPNRWHNLDFSEDFINNLIYKHHCQGYGERDFRMPCRHSRACTWFSAPLVVLECWIRIWWCLYFVQFYHLINSEGILFELLTISLHIFLARFYVCSLVWSLFLYLPDYTLYQSIQTSVQLTYLNSFLYFFL